MHTTVTRVAVFLASCAAATACDSAGSCRYTSATGLSYCEDFVGTNYNESITQNTCTTGNGTWSANACSSAQSLGTCDVAPADTDHAQSVRYTYYTTAASGQSAPTTRNAQQACGLAGGTFSAP